MPRTVSPPTDGMGSRFPPGNPGKALEPAGPAIGFDLNLGIAQISDGNGTASRLGVVAGRPGRPGQGLDADAGSGNVGPMAANPNRTGPEQNNNSVPDQQFTVQQPERRQLSPAARRALAEAAERRAEIDRRAAAMPAEHNGRKGLEPVRYGDWEIKGLASDF